MNYRSFHMLMKLIGIPTRVVPCSTGFNGRGIELIWMRRIRVSDDVL